MVMFVDLLPSVIIMVIGGGGIDTIPESRVKIIVGNIVEKLEALAMFVFAGIISSDPNPSQALS